MYSDQYNSSYNELKVVQSWHKCTKTVILTCIDRSIMYVGGLDFDRLRVDLIDLRAKRVE